MIPEFYYDLPPVTVDRYVIHRSLVFGVIDAIRPSFVNFSSSFNLVKSLASSTPVFFCL